MWTKERQIEIIDRVMVWCFAGLVFVLPMAHTMSIRSVFMFLPLFLWIYKMVLARSIIFVKNQMTAPLAAFAVVASVSLFTAVDPAYTLEELRGEMATDFMLFFLVLNNVRTKDQMRFIIAGLLLGSLVHGLFSSYVYFSGAFDLLDHSFKVGGLTGGYISYSVFIITIIPFIVYMAVTSGGWKRYTLAGLLLLNLLMLYLTHQRGAIVALFVMLLVFFWLIKKMVYVLALAGIIILATVVMPSRLLYHGEADVALTTETAPVYSNTINSRIALWKFTMTEIGSHPFTGIGFGRYSFAAKYSQFRGTDLWHALNTFLNLAIQLGVQGLAVFLFVIYRLINTFRIGASESFGDSRYLFIATLLSLVGFFVRNMFDDHYVDDNAQMFWVLMGLSVSAFIRIEGIGYRGIFRRPGVSPGEKGV